MANGVEEFNPETAMAKLKAGFKSDPGSSDYNKPPEIRFTDSGRMNMNFDNGTTPQGKILDSWVTRYPNSKMKG